MPRKCTACAHEQRDEIRTRILSGQHTIRDIAKFAGISPAAVHRHAHGCIGLEVETRRAERLAPFTAAIEQIVEAEVAPLESALSMLSRLQPRLERLMDNAEAQVYSPSAKHTDRAVAARICGELRQGIELMARLTGELRNSLDVHLHNTPEPDPTEMALFADVALDTIAGDIESGKIHPTPRLIGAVLRATSVTTESTLAEART